MRFGRAKAARKTLQYFERTVALKAPFHVLVDGNFVVAMIQSKLPIHERVGKILQVQSSQFPVHRENDTVVYASVKFCILPSTERELKELLATLKESNHEKVGVFEQAVSWVESECIIEVEEEVKPLSEDKATEEEASEEKEDTENKDETQDEPKKKSPHHQRRRKSKLQSTHSLAQHVYKAAATASSPDRQHNFPYIVATQDEQVLSKLRKLGKTPILRLANNSVLLLENPSKHSQTHDKRDEVEKWTKGTLQDAERQLVKLAKTKRGAVSSSNTQDRRKHKAKEPNPLSCKKSKDATSEPKKKRRRKKKGGIDGDVS